MKPILDVACGGKMFYFDKNDERVLFCDKRKTKGEQIPSAECELNGEKFNSHKELCRWLELRLLERSGEISDLRSQVKFELIPTQREPDTIGKRGGVIKGKVIEHGVNYVADFVYKDKQGNTVVEDTKGMRTKEYVIKRKLMLYFHGIRIREI